MDKLAVQIHDAVSAVHVLGKASKVTIVLDVSPLTKQTLSEPAITIEATITTKLPQPDGNKALFFIDVDGNPTTRQQRQKSLELGVAEYQGEVANG